MGTISTAVGIERRSRTSGYKSKKGFYQEISDNLPQFIAIFGEANTANQTGLTVIKKEVTSAKEVAEIAGYGSPLHQMMRILRPNSGDGIGGIPTFIFPQITAGGATATVRSWTVTGTATSNSTHYIVVNGRDNLDFQNYAFEIVTGDTPAVIAQKMSDAVNGVLGSPCIGTAATTVATFTTKWKGATSAALNIVIDFGNNSAGVSYSQTTTTDGAGVVDLAATLSQFGDDWFTYVINPYGAAQFTALEQFNGIPDPDQPTGRYSGLVFKPFVACFGSTLSDKDDLAAITNANARINQVTNVLCPAPNSKGFPWEAAANAVLLSARVAQDTPHRDVNDKSYPDMPVPADGEIGDMSDYNNRDFLLKKGCSTVMFDKGVYKIQDFVTTYHPDGEDPLQYNYVRNLMLDFNVKDFYITSEKINLRDKTLVLDTQNVEVEGCIKPAEWKAKIFEMFDDLASIALIKDSAFSKDSLLVQISEVNPNRFETFFRYKRTGIARIQSTDAEAGF